MLLIANLTAILSLRLILVDLIKDEVEIVLIEEEVEKDIIIIMVDNIILLNLIRTIPFKIIQIRLHLSSMVKTIRVIIQFVKYVANLVIKLLTATIGYILFIKVESLKQNWLQWQQYQMQQSPTIKILG